MNLKKGVVAASAGVLAGVGSLTASPDPASAHSTTHSTRYSNARVYADHATMRICNIGGLREANIWYVNHHGETWSAGTALNECRTFTSHGRIVRWQLCESSVCTGWKRA
jgi:hypothetical protein